jgi:hypothetical protein
MKIKSLAIAAATLAVGAISSQAQVYSQNTVGYVNVAYPAGQYIMSANPLSTGNDVLTNVLHGVPGASSLSYWTGSGWTTYTFSALGGGHWKSGANVVDNTNLPPGVGFFLIASSAFTNTYSGTVVTLNGGSSTNALKSSFNPVGALTPFSDVVTNPATFNLVVAGASSFEKWDVGSQHFQPVFTYSALSHTWKQGSTVTNPVIGVAEGFFISPSSVTNWVQSLP